jgi:hypothetical protein
MRYTLLLLFSLACFLSFAQVNNCPSLSWYLPANVDYDPEIPTPSEVLGRELGAWHFSPAEIEVYMRRLAQASDRIGFKEIGFSHEGRRLYVLMISSVANQKRLESIRKEHLAISDPRVSAKLNLDGAPIVVWQGHTIHGNEPSGSHAAMIYAYHLAAAGDAQTRAWLDNTVIILDPCMNPDGLQRFSTWVNSHQSMQQASDPISREFHEAWPGGRTNHYWFDLNRDWLLARHPESRARLRLFHDWKPNVLTDHHEMGSNSTYFFQPGVPSRNNPLTPQKTFDLTYQLAEYHAAALDSIGSTYFTGERFDDFYYGKGSTYPDVNGAVGILFEQASSRGHAQETQNGLLTFAFTIRNQLTTSFSTIRGAHAIHDELLEHQRNFYREALGLADATTGQGWVFTDDGDPLRAMKFIELLELHQIDVMELTEDYMVQGLKAEKGHAWFVPNRQPQFRLLTSMFETRTEFTDSIFYDVSSWNMPLAFGLPYREVLKGKVPAQAYSLSIVKNDGNLRGSESTVGYLIDRGQYFAAPAVISLLKQDVRCKVAVRSFTDRQGKRWKAGSIFIPSQNQPGDPEGLFSSLQNLARRFKIDIYAIEKGLNQEGINLGSNDMQKLELPRVALIVGEGVNPYEAGEIWHFFDKKLQLPLTLLPADEVSKANLTRYNTIIMPGGNYRNISEPSLRQFVTDGGLIIAQKNALNLLQMMDLEQFNQGSGSRPSGNYYSYEEMERVRGAQVLGGAIFRVELDLSHPLCFGFNEKQQAVFRNTSLVFNENGRSIHYPVHYAKKPLLTGYASEENQQAIAGSVGVAAYPYGRGHIVAFADGHLFRGFWLGTERFVENAVLFGRLVE